MIGMMVLLAHRMVMDRLFEQKAPGERENVLDD